MRKVLLIVMVAALTVGMMAPAGATKKKTKKGSFSAQALPYPDPGFKCLNGVEGVNKHSEPIRAGFSGILEAKMLNFEGDWDLFITDAEGKELAASVSTQWTGSPPEEEAGALVSKGQELLLVACNFLGGPSADVEWTLTAK